MATRRWYKWTDDGLELRIRAKTRCRREGPSVVRADALEVGVNAPPVDGKANERLIRVLSEAFGVSKSRVHLVRGGGSPCKWFRIDRPTRLPEALQSAPDAVFQVDQSVKADYE